LIYDSIRVSCLRNFLFGAFSVVFLEIFRQLFQEPKTKNRFGNSKKNYNWNVLSIKTQPINADHCNIRKKKEKVLKGLEGLRKLL
jgi:hypothetical protein